MGAKKRLEQIKQDLLCNKPAEFCSNVEKQGKQVAELFEKIRTRRVNLMLIGGSEASRVVYGPELIKRYELKKYGRS